MAISVPLVMRAVASGRELAPKRLALGIVLGVGLGLLIESVLVLLLRAPIVYFVVFSLGLILVLPIVWGVNIGIRFMRRWSPPELGWPAVPLLAVILWPTAIGLPFGARILELRLGAPSMVPAYPGAERPSLRVSLGDNESSSDRVHFVFSPSRTNPRSSTSSEIS